MAAFNPALELWTSGYDPLGNLCWQHKHTKQLHYFASPPGQPPALPPGGFAGGAPHPTIPNNLPFNSGGMFNPPALPTGGFAGGAPRPTIPNNLPFSSGGKFNPPECDKKVWPKNSPLKVAEATYGKGSAGPGLKDIRPPPPSPPTNFKRPPSPPKSSANKAKQWLLQRNKKGEEYYLNTKTSAWQLETPDCLKKYTTS